MAGPDGRTGPHPAREEAAGDERRHGAQGASSVSADVLKS